MCSCCREVKSNQKAKAAPTGGASNYAKPQKAKAPVTKSNKTKAR
jgi:hypothetical protein